MVLTSLLPRLSVGVVAEESESENQNCWPTNTFSSNVRLQFWTNLKPNYT